MLREKSKWKTHKDESTDAEYRGGTARRSDRSPCNGGGAKGLYHLVLKIGQPA